MSYELKSIFTVVDKATNPIKRITQQVEKLNRAMTQATQTAAQFNNAMNRQSSGMNRVTNTINRNTTTINNNTSSITRNTNTVNNNTSSISHNTTIINNNAAAASRARSSFDGLRNTLLGLTGAYLGLQTAEKAFSATIGQAAQFETSKITIEAMFNDNKASQEYLKMVDSFAVNSPLLNSGDMFGSTKGLLTLTKDVGQLENAWGIVERLIASDPTKTIDEAVRGMRELASGDTQSLKEVFNIDKNALNAMKGLSFEDQIKGLDKALNDMNITTGVVDAIGSSTIGQWNSMKERASVFFRTVGEESNSTIGKFLTRMNNLFDTKNSGAFADMLGKGLNDGLTFAINLVEGIGKVRDMIDTVKTKMGELKTMFGQGIEFVKSFIPPSIIADIESLKVKASEFASSLMQRWSALQPTVDMLKRVFSNVANTVTTVLSTLWSVAGPILSLLGNAFSIVSDVVVIAFNNIIAPTILYATKLFSIMWSVVGPILKLLASIFEVVGTVVMWVWDTALKPLVDYLSSGLVKALETVMPKLDAVGDTFSTIGGWISKAADYVSNFADLLKKVKVPDWMSSLGGNATKFVQKIVLGGSDGSHYHGLDYVGFNGYQATLHKGEMVLPRQEAEAYREGNGGGGSITIAKLADQIIVREDADIDKIAWQLAQAIKRERGVRNHNNPYFNYG